MGGIEYEIKINLFLTGYCASYAAVLDEQFEQCTSAIGPLLLKIFLVDIHVPTIVRPTSTYVINRVMKMARQCPEEPKQGGPYLTYT